LKTNAKTGELEIDESKLKAALQNDYGSVANLFVAHENGRGLAARMSEVIKNFQDPVHGVLKTRLKGLNDSIRGQDQQIERQQQRLDQRRATIEGQIAAMERRVTSLQAQGDFLAARLGSPAGATGGSPNGDRGSSGTGGSV
ncbi:hypothetical protein E3A20_10780, partial [Planctomyces bekefii]